YERLALPETAVGTLAEMAAHSARIEWGLRGLTTLPGRSPAPADSLRHFLYHRLGGLFLTFDSWLSALFSVRSLSIALPRGSDEEVVDALVFYAVATANQRGRRSLAKAEGLYARALSWRGAVRDREIEVFLDIAGGILGSISGRWAEAGAALGTAIE